MKKIAMFLFMIPVLLFAQEKSREEQLFWAVRGGDPVLIGKLLDKGANPDVRILTFSQNGKETVSTVFDERTELDKVVVPGNAVGFYNLSDEVLLTENKKLISLFIQAGTDFSDSESRVMKQLVKNSRRDIFKMLLAAGLDINIVYWRDMTLLDIAVKQKNSKLADFFKSKGAVSAGEAVLYALRGKWINPFGIKVPNLAAILDWTEKGLEFYEDTDTKGKPFFSCSSKLYWKNRDNSVFKILSVYPDKSEHSWIIKLDTGKDILYLFYAGAGKIPEVKNMNYDALPYIPYQRFYGIENDAEWLIGTWLLSDKDRKKETIIFESERKGKLKNAGNRKGSDFSFSYEIVWQQNDSGVCLAVFDYGPGNIWYMTIKPDKNRKSFEWDTYGQNKPAFNPVINKMSAFYSKKVKE